MEAKEVCPILEIIKIFNPIGTFLSLIYSFIELLCDQLQKYRIFGSDILIFN
ncbi:MAG TPA: hypothetical protein VE524_00115 [Nitrososphaeraceae archaeon]|jgi:hypothetical protein|nr:hypothetical protein [Nitrososphaeraceae archaeon]